MSFRNLVFAACALTFVVVVVGAYVRLEDAGLGCPDWPGCYGHLVGVPDEAHELERAARAFPDRPVETHKAWKEMAHRYLAGALGLLILAVAVVACLRAQVLNQSPFLALALVVLVALQATLGMWTVTMLLKPVIVTLHLLGGMAILALLTWLALRQTTLPSVDREAARLRPWAIVALLILVLQIALGGWVSTNYAALACQDLPTCRGQWLPEMDFEHGFQFVRELGATAAGMPLPVEALTAIHWTHRAGAVVVLLVVGRLAHPLMRVRSTAWLGRTIAVLLLIQIALGVTNVLAGLPLPVAVAHNAVAAAMLVVLVVINFALSRKPVSTQ